MPDFRRARRKLNSLPWKTFEESVVLKVKNEN